MFFWDHIFNIDLNIIKICFRIQRVLPIFIAQLFIRGRFFFVPPKIVQDGPKTDMLRAFGRRSRLYYLKLEKFCWGILDTHIGPQFNGHFVFLNFLHLGG